MSSVWIVRLLCEPLLWLDDILSAPHDFILLVWLTPLEHSYSTLAVYIGKLQLYFCRHPLQKDKTDLKGHSIWLLKVHKWLVSCTHSTQGFWQFIFLEHQDQREECWLWIAYWLPRYPWLQYICSTYPSLFHHLCQVICNLMFCFTRRWHQFLQQPLPFLQPWPSLFSPSSTQLYFSSNLLMMAPVAYSVLVTVPWSPYSTWCCTISLICWMCYTSYGYDHSPALCTKLPFFLHIVPICGIPQESMFSSNRSVCGWQFQIPLEGSSNSRALQTWCFRIELHSSRLHSFFLPPLFLAHVRILVHWSILPPT